MSDYLIRDLQRYGVAMGVSRATDCGLAKADEVHTDTAAVVVGRRSVALVGV
jgi:hypothetical protein